MPPLIIRTACEDAHPALALLEQVHQAETLRRITALHRTLRTTRPRHGHWPNTSSMSGPLSSPGVVHDRPSRPGYRQQGPATTRPRRRAGRPPCRGQGRHPVQLPGYGPFDPYEPFSEHYKMRKPDPAIYTTMLELMQMPAEELVFVDDTARNLPPAEELGIATVLATDPADTIAQVERLLGLRLTVEVQSGPRRLWDEVETAY